MKRWILLLSCLGLLAGCASVEPVVRPDETVFRDALFVPPQQQPDVSQLFTLTPAMKQYVVEQIQPQVRRKGAQMALIDALSTQGALRLEYDWRVMAFQTGA